MGRVMEIDWGKGGVVKPPAKLKTFDLHYCLALVLYDFECEVAGLAHINESGPNDRYGARVAVPNLYSDMKALDDKVCEKTMNAYLFGELDESLRRPQNRTKLVTQELKKKGIKIVRADVGGYLWRDVAVNLEKKVIGVRLFHESGRDLPINYCYDVPLIGLNK